MPLKADLAFIVVLLGFASYRVAFMIATEEGPFSVFIRVRTLLGAYDYGENSEPRTAWGRGISCPLCVGMYISFFFLLGMLVQFYPWREILSFNAFLIWMGIAGIQVFLNSLNYRN